eukprot:3996611-Prymnesium_polylepis.1
MTSKTLRVVSVSWRRTSAVCSAVVTAALRAWRRHSVQFELHDAMGGSPVLFAHKLLREGCRVDVGLLKLSGD